MGWGLGADQAMVVRPRSALHVAHMTQQENRRLAAVWFADIVGYTELSARDEDLALRVVRELQRIARMQCDARGGRVVKLLGDAVLTVFDSADGAVRAAVTLRDGFLKAPEVQSAGVSLRIGLHVGEVVEAHDGDIYGDAVNAASRIESKVAQPGQVVISNVAYQVLQQRSTIEVEDLGEFELKGLAGPMHLYAVSLLEEAESVDLRDLLQDELAPLQLLDVAGIGGMGEVYLARDPGLRRTLAVKVLRRELVSDKEARARFFREAQIIAGLSHPNVIPIHAVGELKDGTPYLVMDYVEGGSLADRLEQEGPLSVPEARRILGEVASALQTAHERGIVHRDIKAANVLWDLESGRVLVTDWGIAALDPTMELAPETRLTKTGMFIGSPHYMSPEQLAGDEVGPETDMYSLGLLAFELLTGHGPFPAETPREIMISHLREDAPKLVDEREDADPELTSVVAKCLAKDPHQRPAAGEVAQRLAPGAHELLEWPPPGLGPLMGKGVQLSGELGLGLVLLTAPLLLALFWVPPPRDLFVEVTVESVGGGLTLIVGLLLLGRAMWLSVAVGRLWMQGLRLGYGWVTLAEVASDSRRDTGTLLAGGREYTELTSEERGRFRVLRSARVGMVLLGVLSLIPMAWVVLAAGGTSVGSGWIGLLILWGPLALSLMGASFAEWPERRAARQLRRELARRRAPIEALRPLVDPWYSVFERIGGSRRSSSGPKGRSPVGLAMGVGIAVFALIGIALIAPFGIMVAAGPSLVFSVTKDYSVVAEKARRLEPGRPATLEKDPSLSSDEPLEWMLAVTDSVERNRWWRELPIPSELAGSTIVAAVGPYGLCPTVEHCTRGALAIDSLFLAVARGLSPEEQAYLREFASDPRFPAFERLAQAPTFDELAFMHLYLGGPAINEETTWLSFPVPSYTGVREVGYNKVAQAALLLSEGDSDGAERALREIVSVALLLADDGTSLMTGLIGSIVGVRGIEGLRTLYAQTGELEKLAQIQEQLSDVPVDESPGNPSGEAAILQFLGDPGWLRSMKWDLLPALLFSHACGHPYGLLGGIPTEVDALVRGPIHDQMVKHRSEETYFEALIDWESRLARGGPTQGFWQDGRPPLLQGLVTWGWWAGQILGSDRLSSCFLLF